MINTMSCHMLSCSIALDGGKGKVMDLDCLQKIESD